MLAAALVSHPPLLVPALAGRAAVDVAALLAACDAAVSGLLTGPAGSPSTIVCIGAGLGPSRLEATDWGTLAGFGVAVEAPSEHDGTPPSLPLSLTIGRWLLERAGWTGELVLQQVAPDLSTADCVALGGRLAAGTGPRTAWLVLGDASTGHGPKAPSPDDPRAGEFDAELARAFGTADVDGLLGLDAGLAAELGASGRAAWQVLAGAVSELSAGAGDESRPSPPIEASLRYRGAPFGVGYLVATWRFAR